MGARLIDLVDEYLLTKGISAAAFGKDLGDARLVFEMRMGRRPGARMTERICAKINAPKAEVERQTQRRTEWDAETAATLRQMLHNGAGREVMAAFLGVPPNEMKRLFTINGMGEAYNRAMRARRGQKVDGPHVVEPTPSANARATATLAERLNSAGLVEKPRQVERRPLTFAEQLELVRLGKARVVPNVKVERHPTLMASQSCMA